MAWVVNPILYCVYVVQLFFKYDCWKMLTENFGGSFQKNHFQEDKVYRIWSVSWKQQDLYQTIS